MNRRIGVAMIIGLALVVSACSGASTAERLVESQEGIESADFDEGDGSFTVTDDEGNTVTVSGDDQTLTVTGDDGESSGVFGSGEVPADFPVPIAPGGNVQSVIETPPATLLILEYAAADHSYDELVAFYEDYSTSSGVTIVATTASQTDPKLATWVLQTGDADINIVVNDGVSGPMLVQISVNLTG